MEQVGDTSSLSQSFVAGLEKISQSVFIRNAKKGLYTILSDRLTAACFGFLVVVFLTGIFGPYLTPHEYDAYLYQNGEVLRNADPSLAYPLGTTSQGQDVFSRILYGARPTVITGLLGGALIIGVGMSIGVTAGYIGGRVDDALMRLTDLAYGVPLIPFIIVLLAVFGIDFITSVIVIGLLLWRGNARVLRSQVLQIRERNFITAAKATGASPVRIMWKHIFPNIASMAVLFFALGIGYSILLQASLAFIGVSDPQVPSWGIMVRNAYATGTPTAVLWWMVPPGLLISLTVMSAFMLGRRYEAISGSNEVGDEAIAQAS